MVWQKAKTTFLLDFKFKKKNVNCSISKESHIEKTLFLICFIRITVNISVIMEWINWNKC